jgi:hypothetical protein
MTKRLSAPVIPPKVKVADWENGSSQIWKAGTPILERRAVGSEEEIFLEHSESERRMVWYEFNPDVGGPTL